MRLDDPLIRMRCADAAEKVTAIRPDYLVPYKQLLLSGIRDGFEKFNAALRDRAERRRQIMAWLRRPSACLRD